MGWLRTMFLGDIGNRLDIGDNENRISDLRRSMRQKVSVDQSQDDAIRGLEHRCEQLELTVGTLIKLLAANRVVPQAELEVLVNAIEPEDNDL